MLSAATWGGSDFVGGVGARRAPALLVVVSGHIFSFLVLMAICLWVTTGSDAVWLGASAAARVSTRASSVFTQRTAPDDWA